MSLSREYTPEELKGLENKANQFHKALFDNLKIDQNIITNILINTNNEERQIIRDKYKKTYNHPIQDDINSKLLDNNQLLHDISLNMFDTPYEYDARELKKALYITMGGDEDIIIEIFCTRPKGYLNLVDLAYKNFFQISLREDIQNTLSKAYSQLLLAIMDIERPMEQTVSKEDIYNIADDILKKGIKEYANDVNLFKKYFVEKSRKDLILISRAYNEKENKCLFDEIFEENILKKSLFDDIEEEKKIRNKNIRLMKGLIYGVITPAEYFAHKCSIALTGFTSNINTLIRVLISRAEIDMNAIRDYYFKETKNDIKKDIKNEYNCRTDKNIGKILIHFFNK